MNSLCTSHSWQVRNLAASRIGGTGKLIHMQTLFAHSLVISLSNQAHIPVYSLHKRQCEGGQHGSNDVGMGEGKTARSSHSGY
jgi:hypothetical protein